MKKAVEEILKFNEERDWDQFHNPENLAKSICIEAGELLECFQWNNEYDKQHVYELLYFNGQQTRCGYGRDFVDEIRTK